MKRSAILKYLRGETSPEERIEMLRWLEKDPAHLEEYKYLRRFLMQPYATKRISPYLFIRHAPPTGEYGCK
ncbi:hypothetical protein NXY00_17220 [Bacteroides sp. BFG-551]|nr:hypothetical protein [Bacteroides sp. BFG-551]